MSCFWDTLINKIKVNDIKNYFKLNDINAYNFAEILKKNNTLVNTIIVNNNKINPKQQQENFEHIKNYDLKTPNLQLLCLFATR